MAAPDAAAPQPVPVATTSAATPAPAPAGLPIADRTPGGILLGHMIASAHGVDPARLGKVILASGRENDPALWTAIHMQLGNQSAMKLRAEMLKHVDSTPYDPDDAQGAERIPGAAESVRAERAAEPAPIEAPDLAGGQVPASATAVAADTAEGVLVAPASVTFYGVTVVAQAGVHAAALDHCSEFIADEIGKNEHAQSEMKKRKVTVVIIPAGVPMTDLPAFKPLLKIGDGKTFDGRPWQSVRGSGGMQTPDGNFSLGIAEENLVQIKDVISGYPSTYSIGMHEFAHTLEEVGMTSEQKARVVELYDAHAKRGDDAKNSKGTFTDQYAASNEREYFAQSTDAYFGKNGMIDRGTGKMSGNGRDWLRQNDPDMYAFLVDLYENHRDKSGKVSP